MVWLPDGEKISKISLFVLAQLTNVTDRQTDGRRDRHRVPAIATLMHSIARQKRICIAPYVETESDAHDRILCRIVNCDWRRSRSGCAKIIVLKLWSPFVVDSTVMTKSVRSSSYTSIEFDLSGGGGGYFEQNTRWSKPSIEWIFF